MQTFLNPVDGTYWQFDDGVNPHDYPGTPETLVPGVLPEPGTASNWPAFQATAQAALDKSDITVIRCGEHGVMVPQAWLDYRTALRAILRANTGTLTTLPTQPAYPAGT